jgi:dihydrofolate reductase
MPKYVASRTLTEPVGWNGTLLKGDLTAAVRKVKDETEGVIISYGCGVLAYELCRAGVVDELRFWVHTWVLGDRAVSRPFKGRELALRHIATRTYDSGVVCLSYRPRD